MRKWQERLIFRIAIKFQYCSCTQGEIMDTRMPASVYSGTQNDQSEKEGLDCSWSAFLSHPTVYLILKLLEGFKCGAAEFILKVNHPRQMWLHFTSEFILFKISSWEAIEENVMHGFNCLCICSQIQWIIYLSLLSCLTNLTHIQMLLM